MTPTLVYDGECRFCMACVRFLIKRTARPLETVAYQSADLASLALTRDQCAAAVQWVSDGGSMSAHFAVAAALRNARFPWSLAGSIIALPPVRPLAGALYARVAARRRCQIDAGD